jgi:hypothetical protein
VTDEPARQPDEPHAQCSDAWFRPPRPPDDAAQDRHRRNGERGEGGTRRPQVPIQLEPLAGDDVGADSFTLSDRKAGPTYRLSGTDVLADVGRRVRIVGGLVPTPNIAAPAGAIDPVTAAMATPGLNLAGTGDVELLEFSLTRVWPATGSCPPPSSHEPAIGTTKRDGVQ